MELYRTVLQRDVHKQSVPHFAVSTTASERSRLSQARHTVEGVANLPDADAQSSSVGPQVSSGVCLDFGEFLKFIAVTAHES